MGDNKVDCSCEVCRLKEENKELMVKLSEQSNTISELIGRIVSLESEPDKEKSRQEADAVSALTILAELYTGTDWATWADMVALITTEVKCARKARQSMESEYLLPLFDYAKKLGFDLQEMVFNNAGKNSTILFAETVVGRLLEAERMNSTAQVRIERLKYAMISVAMDPNFTTGSEVMEADKLKVEQLLRDRFIAGLKAGRPIDRFMGTPDEYYQWLETEWQRFANIIKPITIST